MTAAAVDEFSEFAVKMRHRSRCSRMKREKLCMYSKCAGAAKGGIICKIAKKKIKKLRRDERTGERKKKRCARARDGNSTPGLMTSL